MLIDIVTLSIRPSNQSSIIRSAESSQLSLAWLGLKGCFLVAKFWNRPSCSRGVAPR